MPGTVKHIVNRIKEGMLQDMWRESKWILRYAKKYWKSMLFYTSLGLVGTGVGLLFGLVSKDLVDIITGHQTGLLVRTFSLYIGLAIGNIVMTQASTFVSNWISIKVDQEIKADIFDKILNTDWEPLTAYHTGDLLTRWGSDASNISNGVLHWIPNLVIYSTKFLSTFAVVLYHDATFAAFAMIGLPVSVIMSRTLMKRMRANNQRSAAMNAKMSGFNQETFSNIQVIKAFDLLRLYGMRLRQLQQEYFSMRIDFQKLSMVVSIIMSLVGLLVSYGSYGWGIYRVWSGAITYGTMTMFLSFSGSLTGTLNQMISLVPDAISLTTSAGRLMDILEMPRESYDDTDKVDSLYKTYKHQGISLRLKQIDYAYQNGTEVFRNVSMDAHPHEIVALVGPSGEGKTTMLRLLLALLHPRKGEAYIYGYPEESQCIPLSPSTRKLFSYVPQGNTMFSGTIAENMRNVKPDATDDEIRNVLQLACAWDFVEKLPDGIHSVVKERGGGFSEGQSQRLSIARALLLNSPILLLDEATSALDVATERKVLRNIMRDEYPRTCIVTTHRPTVLNICTKVYGIMGHSCQLLCADEVDKLIRDF